MDARARARPVHGRDGPLLRLFRNGTRLLLAGLVAAAAAARPASAAVVSAAGSQAPATVRPGQLDADLFTLTLNNSTPVLADTLTSVTFTNLTTGAGSQTEFDLELGTLRLCRDDGDGVFEPGQDTSVGSASASGGQLRFTGLHVVVPALGNVRLFLAADVSTLARDGDRLDVSIQAAADIHMAGALIVNGTFPISPAGDFPVDGMSAAQIALHAVPAGPVVAGTSNNLVLDVTVPANGYQADVLQRLEVVNLGTAQAGADVSALSLYRDDGNGVYNPAVDARLGTLAPTGGGHWLITGLAEPVPVGGVRLFVCADVDLFAAGGHTIRLRLPTSPPDIGIGVASANDGPVDQPVDAPASLSISTSDRVTLTAAPRSPVVVHPGSTGVLVLDLVAKNDYASPRTASRIRVTNTTRGIGSITDLDREFQRVSLRLDGNADGVLGSLAEDPEVSAGLLSGGRADFTGFNWVIPAGTSRHAFVVADVSPTLAADGDSLSLVASGPLDVGFVESTTVVAQGAIDSRALAAIDGMVAAQVGVAGSPAATLGPNEGPALAGAFTIPANGYRPDTLRLVRLENLGTAGPGDLGELRLWRDGGDGSFGAGGGDDQDLGALTWNGATWQSPALAVPLNVAGTRLWVSVVIGPAPADSATIDLGIPVGGLSVASDNDGPIDAAVDGGTSLLISNAPLIATARVDPAESVIGQTVTVRLAVRNRGAETVSGIVPTSLSTSGSGSLLLRSGPSPTSFDLTPAASDTFTWTFDATAPGTVQVAGRAGGTGQVSGLPRSSVTAVSDPHVIDSPALRLDLGAAQAMPVAVAWGQHGIAPLSLTFTNPGSAGTAPVRIERVSVRIEAADGSGIDPGTVLARARLESGGATVASRDTLGGGGPTIDLWLSDPPRLAAGQSVTLALRIDMADSTQVPSFRVAIVDSTALGAAEAPTGRPLPVRLQGATYPYRTALARVVAPATRLEVDAVIGPEVRANRGQSGVSLLTLTLRNPGTSGVTSDVRLLAFAVRLTDTSGVVQPRVADVCARLEARSGAQTLASRTVYPTDDSTVVVALNPTLIVPANTSVPLEIRGDLLAGTPPMRMRVRLADSSSVDARDTDSGDDVPARFLSTPIAGPIVRIEAAAESLRATGSPAFAQRTRIGDTGVEAIVARLRHPGAAGVGRIRVDSLVVLCRDDQRRDVAPASVLSRLAIRWQGVELASASGLPASGGRAPIALPGAVLDAGDTARVEVVVDVSAQAPSGFLELSIAASGLVAVDFNQGGPVTPAAEDGGELPLVSGLTRLDAPARELRADLEDRMPAVLAADGREVVAGVLRLRNTAAAGTDTIEVDRLAVRAAARNFAALAAGAGATAVEAWTGGVRWGATGPLTPDSTLALVVAASPLPVAPGATVALELRFRTVTAAAPAAFRLGLDSAGVSVRQPASALLHIDVRPEVGRSFPQWTGAGTFQGMTLAASVSNFPNPFAAGREATHFVYFLRADARVTLRLVTLDGDLVRTSLDHAPRAAGLRSEDAWDGRNGIGLTVRNGVYVAELVAQYDDGATERVVRKVAVVR